MFEVKDFSTWRKCEGLSEGSGRSEKVWLEDVEIATDEFSAQKGLFKYPKLDPSGQITTEHISEHLACQLGKILDVPTATVELGKYDDRLGSFSYQVNQKYEAVIEGVLLISGQFPEYNAEKLINEADGCHYCLDYILQANILSDQKFFIRMMLFDYLIDNTDRHHSNWAVLASYQDPVNKTIKIREAPLYDNGSSLCCYITEQQIPKYFGKDSGPINALVNTRSKSRIRIDGWKKAEPSHTEVVRYLLKNHTVATDIARHFVNTLTDTVIDDLLAQYPEELLSDSKNRLIRCYLKKKIRLLNDLLEE